MKLNLDTNIRCLDDTKVRLVDVVIDPSTRALTHLVVEAHAHLGHGHPAHRLVPIAQVDDGTKGLRLRFTGPELVNYPAVSTSDFLRFDDKPVADPGWAVGVTDTLALPYFQANFDPEWHDTDLPVTWDRIPGGEIEIRRNSQVIDSTGGEVGTVDGFVCDDDGHITHLVLQHGHQYRRADLAIPIGDVTALDNDRVSIDLDTETVEKLPGVTVHRWHHGR